MRGMILCDVAPRIITLTSDFGLQDGYVAAMKAVILGIAPDASLIDITHLISPQNVLGGGYVLFSVYATFPADSVHLAVIDPGVGTARRPIAVRAPHGTFVGPDNGLFCQALIAQGVLNTGGELHGAEAVVLEREQEQGGISDTFHGRDIFAPAAARLAAGLPLSCLGRSLSRLVFPPDVEPTTADGQIGGQIIHVDHFGNAITNIPGAMLLARPIIRVGAVVIEGVRHSYQEAPVAALIGSSGRLEIACRNGSAAAELGLAPGDRVLVQTG